MAETTEQPSNAKPPGKLGGKLSFIQARETKRTIKARGPRPVSDAMRRVMPLVALIVLALLIIWPVLKPSDIKTTVMKNIPDLVVQNLHYTGLGSKNEPYSISANKATRPGGVANIYDLDRPEAEMTLTSGAWVAAKSDIGRYDQDTRKLWLGGNVQVFHDNGYQFTSDEAQIDLNENYAWGKKPVLIQGSFGEIRGTGFKLLDSGHVMIVEGPAQALLSLQGGSVSGKPKSDKTPDKQ
ncbi:MAG TPA: LPS export ABC transporter periplasmic protein LptC [Alphaproteobacteria bacterium]|nr:LPS export ABC transporter periplasmic protein LptC [Alphaproteobacteria bacterium]